MPVGKKYIGIDLGAESGRVVVGFFQDNKLQLHETHRFITHHYRNNDGRFWDVKKIFEEILKGLKLAQEKFGGEFQSIAVDTWGVDYVLLDVDKNIINDPFQYRDDRTDHIMGEVFKKISPEKIYSISGIQLRQYNTIFQLVAEKNRIKNPFPETDIFLLMPDYFNFLLSGAAIGEYSIVSTTGLANSTGRKWSYKLINELDLPSNIFPEIFEPGKHSSNILPGIAAATGINNSTKIISVAGHDTASAVVSVPAKGNDWAFLSSGTWSLMGLETDKPVTSEPARLNNFTNEGGYNNKTRFLKNIIGLWPVQECKRFWEEENKFYSYDTLQHEAALAGGAEAWINLDDVRFLKPGNMPNKVTSYLNETKQESKEHAGFIIRVILESLAFNYKETLGEIEKISGKVIKRLYAVGGGIRNNLLCQLTADAIGREVVAGPIEGAIIGNIGVQAITSGEVNDLNDLRRIVSDSFQTIIYTPENPAYFENNFKKYKNIASK